MPDTMTLPEKLRSAALRPDGWDVPGLLMDAAQLLECARHRPQSPPQLSNLDNCRREVVPGWALDEILSREG